MENKDIWTAKLAAWTHDPAEKALVLLRDPAGHEGGTVATLHHELFGATGVDEALRKQIRRADWWASAADRPQWPRGENDGPYASWTQVRFTKQPVLIHPLSGHEYDLKALPDIDVEAIKAVSIDHFRQLVVKDDTGSVDRERTALAFWRFAPQTPAGNLRGLWENLPADTRVPDHSIWTHLDLTSAFATAMHADPDENPALLAMSFGPVQEFIAQARTTSDLWAGSHLLASLAWEGLKVICEQVGPDCILFPQLRGVPQVDLWLRDRGLPEKWFQGEEWLKGQTDANPLFAASLPNRFVALVPAARAQELAGEVKAAARRWVIKQAHRTLDALLEKADVDGAEVASEQIETQLRDFPEVHWAAVPWAPLIDAKDRQTPETEELAAAMRPFYPAGQAHAPGFLCSEAWQLLSGSLAINGTEFYTPNAGVLYPAVYDLLDRVQAAAKSVRAFDQSTQTGYRCSLCGQREWLTHDRELLEKPPRERCNSDTLWSAVQGTSWARKGEHLCAPCALKRLWPTLYTREIRSLLGTGMDRYVISTHTMALATTLWGWMRKSEHGDNRALVKLRKEIDDRSVKPVALPKKIADELRRNDARYPADVKHIVERLPALLEAIRESGDAELNDRCGDGIERDIEKALGSRPENYYALILMDGDNMGAWLSGTGAGRGLPFHKSWHPKIRNHVCNTLAATEPDLARYAEEQRPVSPARHMAISGALNAFSLHIARLIVEDIGKGKLLYAGGDDVLAMVSVDDLLSVMLLLRLAYSGVFPKDVHEEAAWDLLDVSDVERRRLRLRIGGGYVQHANRLHRMMGHRATASTGAVVAHHQVPLGHVLRQLRGAEQRAKHDGGRDAFAITLIKRSGGAESLICPWLERNRGETPDWCSLDGSGPDGEAINLEQTPLGQLMRLRNQFAHPDFSRRAAYLTAGWMEHIPDAALGTMLGYQFQKQVRGDEPKKRVRTMGERISVLANKTQPDSPQAFVAGFLAVAEFLAREGRVQGSDLSCKEGVA